MTNEKHKIVSFKDIVEVATKENCLRLVADFKAALGMAIIIKERSGVIIDSFTWCDDGVHKIDVKINIREDER